MDTVWWILVSLATPSASDGSDFDKVLSCILIGILIGSGVGLWATYKGGMWKRRKWRR